MRAPGAAAYRCRMRTFDRLEALAARAARPALVDVGLAAFFVPLCIISVSTQDITGRLHRAHAGDYLLVVLITVLVAFRRRIPLAALSVASAAEATLIISHAPEGATPVAIAVLVYSVAAWSPFPRALAGMTVVAAALVCMALFSDGALDFTDAGFSIGTFGILWSSGVALRARRSADNARVQRATELAEAESQRAATAIAEERLRIAQELHDVVAHSISVIAVQAGVGAHFLETNTAETRAALDAINRTSRNTLNELRRLLGVLRGDDGVRSHAPAPTLSDLPVLVAQMKELGLPITVEVEGESSDDRRAVEMSAYRVVQEALTNVIKHAGVTTAVDIRITNRPDALRVEITDDGRGAGASSTPSLPSGRHGLIGIRERVDVWGGTMTAGPRAGGGYAVVAEFPLDGGS